MGVYVTWQRQGIFCVTSVSRIRSTVQNLFSEILSAAVDNDTVSAKRSEFYSTSLNGVAAFFGLKRANAENFSECAHFCEKKRRRQNTCA